MTTKKIFSLLAVAVATAACSPNASAQLEIGGWQTHFAYNGTSKIAQSADHVFVLSNGNMYSVDKADHSIEAFSKLNGLSDGLIKDIAYDEQTNTLVVCYENMVIDIVKDGKTARITDIAAKEISNKSVNKISFANGNIYLSCGFGIVVVNTAKSEIASTYIIGDYGSYTPVLNTVFSADSIYAITSSWLYSASRTEKRLQDYKRWNRTRLPGQTAYDFCLFNGKIHFFGDHWYTKEPNGWEISSWDARVDGLRRASVQGDKLITYKPNYASTATIFNSDLTLDTLIHKPNFNDVALDGDRMWLAEDSLTLVDRRTAKVTEKICPFGPYWGTVSFFRSKGNLILSGKGRAWNERCDVQSFDGDEWQNSNYSNIPDQDIANNFMSVRDAVWDPKDPKHVFVATWYGLYEFYDGDFLKLTHSNGTTLNAVAGSGKMVILENVEFDRDNNLWVVNTQAKDGLHCMDPDGRWHALNVPGIYNIQRSADLLICKNNMKVVVAERLEKGGAGVCFVKTGKQPYSVDQSRTFVSFPIADGSKVTPSVLYCATEDLNGDVWVGSDIGPFVFKNVGNVFAPGYSINRIKLTRKDDASLADYLLATDQINTIAVDGANRKWIGTASSGLYLISADGQKTIHHFTTENSPLTTNSIFKVGIDPESGLVYIQTGNGLFTFQSDAANGKEDFGSVHVFPNPVRPDYSGPITVTGLMEDTEVRITDALGHVVSHGKSNGSMYTWDGMLANGRHAATGVYFVFQTTTDGANNNVAKFAIIKR